VGTLAEALWRRARRLLLAWDGGQIAADASSPHCNVAGARQKAGFSPTVATTRIDSPGPMRKTRSADQQMSGNAMGGGLNAAHAANH
jgi:hypothetical protein